MVEMTDLDTSGAGTPVVWPKWCYAAKMTGPPHLKDSNPTDSEAQDLVLNNNNITSVGKDKDLLAPNSAHAIKKQKRIRSDLPNGVTREENTRDSSESKNDVKSERLSPDPGSDSQNITTTTVATSRTTPSPSTSPKSDKSPASHRTRTPSFPGTPPHPAFTPPGGLPPGFERFSPAAALGGMGPLPGGPPALKQMESLMSRNCSDLMRSLAAKYNNSNPNDYFSSPHNGGYLRPPGLGAFKSTGPPHFLGLPPSTTITPQPPASAKDYEKKSEASQAPSGVGPATHPGAPGHMFPGAPGALPGFPGFPLVDVSSTQVLMNFMRNTSASQQAQLENYLRGAAKRPGDAPTSPLDLSASVPNKRIRTDPAKPFDVKHFLSIPQEEERRAELVKPQANRSPTPSKPRQSPTPASGHRTSPIPCSDKNCNSLESVAHWTVNDVVSFVASIELCAEYSEAFRENRIDGSSLPLLTEEHLTSSINMKLGPALKLRSVLARKLGACNVCLHCDHCHTQPQERRQAPT